MPLRLVAPYTATPCEHTSFHGFGEHLRREGLSESTVSGYLADLKVCGVPESATEADHANLSAWISASDAAPRTRARRLCAGAKFYDYAFPSAATNPYRTVRRPRFGVVLPSVVPTPEESRTVVNTLLARESVAGTMYAAAVALMAGGGLRVSEIVALRCRDIDLRSSTVHVVDGKGRKSRDVPLGEFAMTVLRRHLLDGPERARFTAADRVFPVTARSIQRTVAACRDSVGGALLHPHAFRHGFGTTVQEQSGDLRLTADLLGHASITTAAIYTHVADHRRVAAVSHAL